MKLPPALLGSLCAAAAGFGLAGCARLESAPSLSDGTDTRVTKPSPTAPVPVTTAKKVVRPPDGCPACGRG